MNYAFIIERSKWSTYESGYANGYVAIPKDHPLFEKHYSFEVPYDETMKFNGNFFGLFCSSVKDTGMVGLDLAIDVHCGLTFSKHLSEVNYSLIEWLGESLPPDADYWVFGFDTAHVDDNLNTCDREFCIAETLKLKEILDNWK